MTITFHLHTITIWLFASVGICMFAGFLLSWLWGVLGGELEAIMPMTIGFVLAVVALILAIGSML